ncbi:hypothetical protein AAMO2058_000778400 [Amorphochlora amoebiformis]
MKGCGCRRSKTKLGTHISKENRLRSFRPRFIRNPTGCSGFLDVLVAAAVEVWQGGRFKPYMGGTAMAILSTMMLSYGIKTHTPAHVARRMHARHLTRRLFHSQNLYAPYLKARCMCACRLRNREIHAPHARHVTHARVDGGGLMHIQKRNLRIAAISLKANPAQSGSPTNPCTTGYIVYEDGAWHVSRGDSKAFLDRRPRGAYTTARTKMPPQEERPLHDHLDEAAPKNTPAEEPPTLPRVFDLESHINRTFENLNEMWRIHATQRGGIPRDSTTIQFPREKVEYETRLAMRTAIQAHHEMFGPGEVRVTVLANWDCQPTTTSPKNQRHGEGKPQLSSGAGFSISCHAGRLPPPPEPPIKVEIRGTQRVNARIKDSSWITQRASHSALVEDGCDEFLLLDQHKRILEGSQTNFYAIINGTLYTAEEGVLLGTVRRLVLHVCEQEGIPVKLEPPSVKSLFDGTWEGAAISSTSRLFLPVDEICIPRLDQPKTISDPYFKFDYQLHTQMHTLATKVAREVDGWSEVV